MQLPKGFILSGSYSGIKDKGLDLGLICCQNLSVGVGFFTTNANPSYSVIVSRQNIAHKVKAILVNSGNANCFISGDGLRKTQIICRKLAGILKAEEENILIASTGIIGRRLPDKKIISALPALVNNTTNGIKNFAQSIITTDSFIKISSRNLNLGAKPVCITGFAKGAGMISPHLATMLVFILTDAAVDRKILKKFSSYALGDSFNSITVDGCMSTNDSVYVLTSAHPAHLPKKDLDKFGSALREVFIDLAKMIVQDGEGATKFIRLTVNEALTDNEAEIACRAICNSALFKTAMYGENSNWGRIIAALGAAGIKVKENNFKVRATSLAKKNIRINVYLGRGRSSKTLYTSDLTPAYVKLNAGH